MLQDEILIEKDIHVGKRHVLVYFITGNPGLVEYYRPFLQRLSGRLSAVDESCCYSICGCSLAGFALNPVASIPGEDDGLPYSLDRQLLDVRRSLERRVAAWYERASSVDGADDVTLDVVLVGHSVGSYILLETVRWWQQAKLHLSDRRRATLDDELKPLSFKTLAMAEIIAGVCLFPTVVDIALSPSGRKITPLFRLPYFALFMHFVSKAIFTFMPLTAATKLIRSITGMPDHAALTTASFLKSKTGVYQALYMCKDEMNQITSDKWPDSLWGEQTPNRLADTYVRETAGVTAAPSSGHGRRTKLFFYWGQDDHWVANRTRDAVISARARTSQQGDADKPYMEVDGQGIPHSFCLAHSELVAAKVADFVLSLGT